MRIGHGVRSFVPYVKPPCAINTHTYICLYADIIYIHVYNNKYRYIINNCV